MILSYLKELQVWTFKAYLDTLILELDKQPSMFF